MKQFILVIMVSAALCFGTAYSLGLMDSDPDYGPAPILTSAPQKAVPQEKLGEFLYTPAAFPKIELGNRGTADHIVLVGAMNPVDQEQVASQVPGQILFIGEEVDSSAVHVAGSAAFIAEPYYPSVVRTGGQQVFAKFYRRLYEGETIKHNQMVAMIEPAKALAEVLGKIVKLRGASAEFEASLAGEKEGKIRLDIAEKLLRDKATTRDDYGSALLTYVKLRMERVKQEEAVKYAENEKLSAETDLNMFEIRPTMPTSRATIRSIVRQRGEVVKPGDPVMLVQNNERLQAEALIEEQYYMKLRNRMDLSARDESQATVLATIEPTIIEGSTYEMPAAHALDITSVAVSKKMQIVAGSEDRTVSVWSQKLTQIRNLDHDEAVKVVACTPPAAERNLCLVGCTNGSVYLWDLDNDSDKSLKHKPSAHGNDTTAITSVAFSPDGKLVATGGVDGSIRLWSVQADGDDYLKELYAFTPANGVAQNQAHDDALTALHFTPQSRLVSASKDKSVRVWQLKEKGAVLDRKPLLHRQGDIQQLGVSQDGKWMLFDQGRTLKFVSIEKHLHTHTLSVPANSTPFETLAMFSPDSKLMLTAGAPEGRLQLWRTPDGTSRGFEVRQFATRERLPVTCAAFAPDAGFAVSASGARLYVWAIPTEKEVNEHRLEDVPMTLISQSIDPTTRLTRIGFGIANPTSERYPNGRFEAGRPVTIVIR